MAHLCIGTETINDGDTFEIINEDAINNIDSILINGNNGRTLHSSASATCVHPSSPQDTDSVYAYVGTNHGSLTGSCFESDNQARVDVKCTSGSCSSGSTVWTRNPSAGTSSNVSPYTGTPPCGKLAGSNVFRYGPFPVVGGGNYEVQIWEYGCMVRERK